MKTLIIEDEKPAARRLARMLEKLDLTVVAMLHSVEESVSWFQQNEHPELIFLDIQLSDGLSFEIFEHTTVSSTIIFTTAYDEYALQAFKFNSIDYLLKPIDDEELKKAVEKYQNLSRGFQKNQLANIDFSEIKKMLINPLERNYKKRFTVRVGQHIKMIATDEIICFFSENKGTFIHTTEGRNYLIESSLEDLEPELPPEDFFRVNRKFFINIKAIVEIVAYSNSRLKLKLKSYQEQEIIVARERVRDFKNWLE